MKLEKNVGKTDKYIRLVIGGLLLAAGISGYPILIVLALIVLFTGLTNFCGLYTVLGINTCKK